MGTSLLMLVYALLTEDHPHAYGDKMLVYAHSGQTHGSSPRVWGQVQDFYNVVNNYRIIPTRMGTSITPLMCNLYDRDHPHAYGAKTKEIKENSGFAKSTA